MAPPAIPLISNASLLLNLHGYGGSIGRQKGRLLPSHLPPIVSPTTHHQLSSKPSLCSRAILIPMAAQAQAELALHPHDVAPGGSKPQLGLLYGSWALQDALIIAQILSTHILAAIAMLRFFSWSNLSLAAFISLITGLGITLSYHRNLTHRSFNLPRWLEYFWAYCGVQAMQGDPLWWVSTHRFHHQHADTPQDPHSPAEGFLHSHLGWLYDYKRSYERNPLYDNVPDLIHDPFYRFLNKTYPLHPALMAVALYAMGGIPYVLWGWGFRCVFTYHATFLASSAAHMWGYRSWNTRDNSRNNWWVAFLTLGEGWHNNHHAFPTSARLGLAWWEYDMTWVVVKGLQVMGLVTDINLPTQRQMERLALSNYS